MTENTSSPPVQQIEVSRDFLCEPETIFDAWLDRELVGKWLFASPGGVMVRVEVDPVEGGKFAICEQRGDEIANHFGTFLELHRPSQLIFSYAMSMDEVPTVVTVDIEPLITGCRLTLSHELEPKWAHMADLANEGWTLVLAGLAYVTEG